MKPHQDFYVIETAEYESVDPDIAANADIKARLRAHIRGMKTGETQQRQLEHTQREEKRKAEIVIAGRPEGFGDWA